MPETPAVCSICWRIHGKRLTAESKILHELYHLRSETVVSTKRLASRIYLSLEQTRRYLRELEETGEVERIGERGGWKRVA